MTLLSLLAPLFLLLLLCLSSVERIEAQQGGYALYSFCYSVVNSLSSSPYLPFSFYAQGTLNVSSTLGTSYWGASYGSGYQVVGATGQRTYQTQGQAAVTNNIVGVAPLNGYAFNDNLLQVTGSAFTAYHSLSLQLDSTVQFAAGPAVGPSSLSGSPYLNLLNYTAQLAAGAGVTESDLPPNDANTVVLTSSWSLAPATGGYINSFPGCPFAAPAAITVPSALVSAYASSLNFTFCYEFSSGPGFGTDSGGLWSVAASGVFTTTGYLGTTAAGQAAYLITAISGFRLYSVNDVTTNYQTVAQNLTFVGLLGVNGARAEQSTVFISGQNGSYAGGYGTPGAGGWYSNRVLYPLNYPWLDTFGVHVLTSGAVDDEISTGSVTSSSSVVRLLVAPIGVQEQSININAGITEVNYDASFLLAPAGTTSSSALYAQCSVIQPNPATYQFCYYLDNSAQPAGSIFRNVISVQGSFTATGPVPRDGRLALLLQSINGVRTFINMTSSASTQTVQNIIALKFNGEDRFLGGGDGGSWNDNYVYTTPNNIDYNGILFTLSTPPLFPQGAAQTSNDIGFWWITPQYTSNAIRYLESPGNEAENLFVQPTTTTHFNYQPWTGQPYTACAAADSLVPAPAPFVQYSLCFYQTSTTASGATYIDSISAAVTVYSIAISVNGRSGFPIANVTGVRQFASSNGYESVTSITGLASGWQGAAEGFTAGVLGSYDQVLYTSAPYLDSGGLLLQYNGLGASLSGAIFDASVLRLFYNSATSSYTDQTLYNITYSTATQIASYQAINITGGTVAVLSDGGASYTAGTVSGSSCAAPPTQTYNFCYLVANTQGSPWSVSAVGQLTVQTAYTYGALTTAAAGASAGYQVTSITGIRTVQTSSGASSQRITGLAAVNSFQHNDNVVTPGQPYLDNSFHSLSFVLGAPSNLPNGLAGGQYVNLNNLTSPRPAGSGLTEAALPANDGVTTILSSSFDLRLATTAAYQCPFAVAASAAVVSSSSSSSCSSSSSLSGGAVAGIVIGVVVGAALLLCLAVFLARSARQFEQSNKALTSTRASSDTTEESVRAEHSQLELGRS